MLVLKPSVDSFTAGGVNKAFKPAVKAGSNVHNSDTQYKT